MFYEVAVRSYQDSNADGIGDIRGLINRLDHLQWLGITAVWILPILPSPMRDGGYDVSDFTGVGAEYGTIDDVCDLLEKAHARGIRVITDFIVNHSSDKHPWFVEARQPGSRKRDWYVWSDDPGRYPDARVVFVDTHTSNWTWDEVAGQYYWHRFFDHQPDLNYENPEVQEAMMDAIRFWLDLGFDGLRLDAVPYLFEAEGTNCENLPATHEYLKRVRAMVDREFPDAVLLAEANQRPNDVLPYLGEGDECHMVFHFPVMPRLFLALATGDVTPIVDTLEATPRIPHGTQWALFLRNHDELTLEMVADDERATLYEAYAPDRAMRRNIGIRRRLSPLLDGDRRKIELLNAVMFSLPGTPILYYGDEIGMGDEYLLEDRDGMRTPMQWDATPSAGWSDAAPTEFSLPVVTHPSFAPSRVNVEDQVDDSASLLRFMRNLTELRSGLPELSTAAFTPIETGSVGVLGYERDSLTVLANFTDGKHAVAIEGVRHVAGNGSVNGGAVSLPAFGWIWLRDASEDPPRRHAT